ncbi:diguanylate cyclase, partial [Pseudomonas sp. CES]
MPALAELHMTHRISGDSVGAALAANTGAAGA